MHIKFLRNDRGLTLAELMVSIGIMSFIFATMAYLVFVTGRSTFQVREQSLSQQQAAAAAERITNTLRNASGFRPYTGDSMATTQTRVMFDTPDPSGADGIRTGIVAFVEASTVNDSDGIVKIFEDADDYTPATLATDKAEWEYEGIQDFELVFNSPSWLTLTVAYSYRGFRMTEFDSDDEDEVHDSRLVGEFLTDVIAKNHHPGESAQYGETTSTLFQL